MLVLKALFAFVVVEFPANDVTFTVDGVFHIAAVMIAANIKTVSGIAEPARDVAESATVFF